MSLNRTALPFYFGLLGFLAAGAAGASELKPATVKAFAHYQQLTESRIRGEVTKPGEFLYLDTLPPGQKKKEFARVKDGDIFIHSLSTNEDGKKIGVPDGMAHHWVAVEFIPKVRLTDVMRVVQDYSRYAEIFKPDVQRCQVLHRDGEHFLVYYRFYKHTIVTVSYNAEFEVEFNEQEPDRVYSFSRAVRIAEVRNAGEANEQEYPVGNDHGYLWRLNFYARYMEADGGVYVQIELLSLSRTVPALFAWLVNPYLRSIPREYLTDYLRRLGKAVAGAVEEQNRNVGAAGVTGSFAPAPRKETAP